MLITASVAAVTAIDSAATPDRPVTVIRAAREVLDRDGLDGLKFWLAERNRSRPKQRTLIIDSRGQEILGQKLPEFFGGCRRDLGPVGLVAWAGLGLTGLAMARADRRGLRPAAARAKKIALLW